ncbi:hypothetical protein SISNIDRAFT_458686 [Sistotremastrum niveocremeum HHB9708]|uniref:Zn(2)-C6 fungal-type domain-containing protein n=2 Tax=Sistotremastraceae TaxID=3402574 RepID=A0A164QAM6_9AGAM|nr:hypothetical protein SISNIDRAFT_458686 [Sistotremastrum niveocremeum HHB9708]KZT36115.1 hypothetical protein SISSUDRAFT_1050307 [Sistotremastrum suecicum HHB10207 ss-3]
MHAVGSLSGNSGDGPEKNRRGDPEKPTPTGPRIRTTKACDRCRASRIKCEPSRQENACRACLSHEVECVFTSPTRKRGPPKGHLRMLENQLYEAEAVIGILQSLPDESFRSAFREMAGDPIAGRVLQRIAQAPYGRFGPDQDQEYYETRESDNETTGSGHSRAAQQAGPSVEWQDQMIARIAHARPEIDDDIESEDEEDEQSN